MKNEKPQLFIAIGCGVAAVTLFILKISTAGYIFGLAAFVAILFFAETRWHNIQAEEMERYRTALRQSQEKALGRDSGEGGQKRD